MTDADESDAFGFQEIPPEFHSFETDHPFTTCVDCATPLAEADGYVVQKVMKKGEVIFEFALCHACHEKLHDDFSEQTREALGAYMEENVKEVDSIDRCSICLKQSADFDEFAMAAQCWGNLLISQMIICDECRMKVEDLISDQTRRAWDDFVGSNFPGVPESVDRPVLI